MDPLECGRCGYRVAVGAGGPPQECPNCFNELPVLPAAATEPAQPVETAATSAGAPGPGDLVLRCLVTARSIHVPADRRVVLGREAHGRDVLGRVMQISGKHCTIERADGGYRVTDLGSRNGTFVGEDRRDCRAATGQILRHGEVLILGREEFIAAIEGMEETQRTSAYVADEVECANCRGYRSAAPPADGVCPRCYAYNPPSAWPARRAD